MVGIAILEQTGADIVRFALKDVVRANHQGSIDQSILIRLIFCLDGVDKNGLIVITDL